MIVEKIKNLPETVNTQGLRQHFYNLLDEFEQDKISGIDVSEALCILADKQWHNYDTIEVDLKGKLEEWVEKVWDTNSKLLVKNIIRMVAYLGLNNSFEKIKNSLEGSIKDNEIRLYIEDAVKELKDTVHNPYFNMK